MNSSAFSVGEVWNNIYAASYQDIYFGKEVFKKGWLYSNSTQLFKTVKEYLERNTPVNNWDLRSKLYFMMLMKDKAGNEAFRDFNQQYRKLCYQTDFTPGAYTLLDKLADSYSKIGRVDIIPFIRGRALCFKRKNYSAIPPIF